eukprot:6119422-Amphidinium_carterae.1
MYIYRDAHRFFPNAAKAVIRPASHLSVTHQCIRCQCGIPPVVWVSRNRLVTSTCECRADLARVSRQQAGSLPTCRL